jgi:hypothetical protein
MLQRLSCWNLCSLCVAKTSFDPVVIAIAERGHVFQSVLLNVPLFLLVIGFVLA